MEPGRGVREAALQLVADVEPVHLRDELWDLVRDGSMVPGAVTVITAERLGGADARTKAMDRAVGVQLCYEGLRLTRQLIREEERYAVDEPTEHYLALVAAEVLVSRGFVELAETAVAAQAIEIVRRFSRHQTADYDADPVEPADTLEHDVVSLAVAAGATVVLDTVPPAVAEQGDRLAEDVAREPLPPVTAVTVPIRAAVEAAVASDPVVLND